MSPEFEAAYLRHAALSFDKQLNLAQVIGNRNWNFSMDSGQLSFGKRGIFDKPLVFDVQILGTASQDSGTWLWSWANESVPESLASASLFLRENGGLAEFSTPQFPLNFEDADEHRIAMTSVGVLGGDAYYRGPYEGGAACFLLRDPRLRLGAPDVIHISTLFPQLISSLSVLNHRAAFMGYLQESQIEPRMEGDAVRVEIDGSSLLATFDTSNRLGNLQVMARPKAT